MDRSTHHHCGNATKALKDEKKLGTGTLLPHPPPPYLSKTVYGPGVERVELIKEFLGFISSLVNSVLVSACFLHVPVVVPPFFCRCCCYYYLIDAACGSGTTLSGTMRNGTMRNGTRPIHELPLWGVGVGAVGGLMFFGSALAATIICIVLIWQVSYLASYCQLPAAKRRPEFQ